MSLTDHASGSYTERRREAVTREMAAMQEIVVAERVVRAEQRAIERDRIAVRRRAPPVQQSGGVSFPGRPRR